PGAAWATTRASAWMAAWDAAWDARMAAREAAPPLGGPDRYELERRWQASLLLGLFGNPFEVALIHPDSLGSNQGPVVNLAQVIYEEDRFGDLPILADALEEAGCNARDILDHCRGRQAHYRGCWVVDLVLRKT